MCPERCERGMGFPVLVQGLSSGGCAPWRPLMPLPGPRPRDQWQERPIRQGATADPPAAPQFRVSSVFAVDWSISGQAEQQTQLHFQAVFML